jgi:hypothetical protein
MAIPSTAVWEIRPTVGSDTNGGGFDPAVSSPGTDFSQQNSPNFSGNNISTTDAACSGGTTLTSATASFTAAIVGNIIYLAGGGATTGWYEVTAYSNSTTVTLDRTPGTVSGGTMNIGGALATVAAAYATSVPDNTFWIKATGDYTATATLILTGQSQNITDFIGYTSTRGDGGQATWTTTTNSMFLLQAGASNPAGFSFDNIYFTTSAGTPDACLDGSVSSYLSNIRFYNCVFDGFTTATNGAFESGVHYQIACLFLDSCEIKNCTADGVDGGTNTYMVDCFVHNNTGIGAKILYNGGTDTPGACAVDRCVFYDNGSHGLEIYNDVGSIGNFLTPIISNCAFVGNGGNGLDTTSTSTGTGVAVRNCVFSQNTGYGWNPRAGQYGPRAIYANAYYSNTSGANSNTLYESVTDVTLTAQPFTNPSSGDFTLNSTSGGGAALKGAGFPSSLP